MFEAGSCQTPLR